MSSRFVNVIVVTTTAKATAPTVAAAVTPGSPRSPATVPSSTLPFLFLVRLLLIPALPRTQPLIPTLPLPSLALRILSPDLLSLAANTWMNSKPVIISLVQLA